VTVIAAIAAVATIAKNEVVSTSISSRCWS
jgi:hypothetical protein